jgi:multisubunit Na+/H+ antiporter MnhF subunit
MIAGLTPWALAAAALLPPLAAGLALASRGRIVTRLIAVQFTTAIVTALLVLASFDQNAPSLIDLPLALALLSLPGTLILATFLERWL